jgi:Tfp pilus assembly protein PilF
MKLFLISAAFALALSTWAAPHAASPPSDVSPHFQSALALEHLGDIDKAIDEYKKAIQETPNHSDSH